MILVPAWQGRELVIRLFGEEESGGRERESGRENHDRG
jgi:hypothetical protein